VAICPVQRDQRKSTNVIPLVRAYVYDRHPIEDVGCFLRAMNLNGELIWAQSRVSANFQPEHQTLEWRPNVRLTPEDTVVLTCTLPAATPHGISLVASYWVLEE
jgi:hypothetical protein